MFLSELLVFTHVAVQNEECVCRGCSGKDPENLERVAHVQITVFGAVPSYSLLIFFPRVNTAQHRIRSVPRGWGGKGRTRPLEPRLILPEISFNFIS